jgi:hypothetical protein
MFRTLFSFVFHVCPLVRGLDLKKITVTPTLDNESVYWKVPAHLAAKALRCGQTIGKSGHIYWFIHHGSSEGGKIHFYEAASGAC